MSIAFRVAPRASCLSLAVAAALFPSLFHSSAARAGSPGDAVADAALAERTTTLDSIQVNASNTVFDASAGSTSRLDLGVMEMPASVTVIDRQLLDARGVRTTREALAGIPGLTVASPPGNGNAVTWR